MFTLYMNLLPAVESKVKRVTTKAKLTRQSLEPLFFTSTHTLTFSCPSDTVYGSFTNPTYATKIKQYSLHDQIIPKTHIM